MNHNNTKNFTRARFGMFLHWGLYSVPAGRWKGERMDYIGEWIQSRFRIPNAEYAALAEQFNPTLFDADEWVKCAKAAGMTYLVFTAKHHDGFAMYRSRISKYNVVDATPFGRDVLRELALACRKYGMKLGIYYSHCLDWHEADGADPGPDSPKNFGMSWGNDWDYPDWFEKNFSRYFENKALRQIGELLSDYGPVFLMWFDCPLGISEAQSRRLRKLVKSLQPDCLINGRIGHGMGDFGSLGDNQSPAGKSRIPLESAQTLNRTWGYKKDDHDWRDAEHLIDGLLSCNEKDVNYLLNIGPRPDGRLPEASLDILGEVAEWRNRNGVRIEGTGPNPFPQAFPWGYCTLSGSTLQFFVKEHRKEIEISGLRNEVKACNLPFERNGTLLRIALPAERGDDLPLVVKVKTTGKPEIDRTLTLQDGVLILSPASGEIVHGNAAATASGETKLGAAAEVLTEKPECSLNDGGALTQWNHPGDGVSWDIRIPEAGSYEFQVVTENRCHSALWTGGRRVRLEFAGQRLECELREDEKLTSRCYARAISKIGTLTLSGSASGILRLSNLSTNKTEAANMNLTTVRIQQQTRRTK